MTDSNTPRPVRIGIGGPVGSGKTMLLLRLIEALHKHYALVAITNDIYTKEDEQFLVKNSPLEASRILGVETGGCPHTAIRDDTSMNEVAIEDLLARHADTQVVLLESGGDNLSATFSPDLVDAFIYVIDVAEGDKIPRKGGPAIRFSDLLIINKTELAPYVGADLDVMARDSKKQREERPFVFCDLKSYKGLDDVVAWLEKECFFAIKQS
jgi:urease accessory protein